MSLTQLSYIDFRRLVTLAHEARNKHENLELSLNREMWNTIAQYVEQNPSWADHITITQARDTVPYCIELANGTANLE